MTLTDLKNRFDTLLTSINGSIPGSFSTSAENAYEALTLTAVMVEYDRIYGPITRIVAPSHRSFLNQKPGKFRSERSFRIDFASGTAFYFAADVEVLGLEALGNGIFSGEIFEADVVVIPSEHSTDIINNYNRYPAPQHLHSVYECKFGKYHKSQLRELLGLKRHLTFMGPCKYQRPLFGISVSNSILQSH